MQRRFLSAQSASEIRCQQDHADLTHFVLVEIYRSLEATVARKETAHYAAWRDTATPMMAQPRTSVQYSYVFDMDAG